MALSSTIAYCENQDVFDIYPLIDKFDLKRTLTNKWAGSGTYRYHNSGSVSNLYKNGVDLGAPEEDEGQLNAADKWLYNATSDFIIINESRFLGGSNPNLDIFEVGDDWDDVIVRFRRKASRLIEYDVGKSTSREILKDREGNYPSSINHITALKTAILLIMAHDPNHPDLVPLNAEYDEIIGKIRSGKIVMPNHITENSSKGILRGVVEGDYPADEIGETDYFQDVFPIELKGSYSGSGYELLYLYLFGHIGGLVLADLSYWVKGKSSTKLIDKLLVDTTVVNFDYQYLGIDNLYVRFSRRNDSTVSGAWLKGTADSDHPIIYEIELWGNDLQPTVSQIKPTTLSRDTLWH